MVPMPVDNAAAEPVQPSILSMEVDDEDSFESEYRLRIGTRVKYLVISPGTLDRDTLSFPLQSLTSLPFHDEWTVAHISRDQVSGDLKTSLSSRALVGVKRQWHHVRVDCMDLEKTTQLTAMAFEAVLKPSQPSNSNSTTVIAKIARFEWEVPRVEQETRAYQVLEGSGLAPRFLGHIHESGRIMGFILEKAVGRPASMQDLDACETALRNLHRMGFLHGNVNRHNFLITDDGVKLLDFECLREDASPELMSQELQKLRNELVDDSGRGGGFLFPDDG